MTISRLYGAADFDLAVNLEGAHTRSNSYFHLYDGMLRCDVEEELEVDLPGVDAIVA